MKIQNEKQTRIIDAIFETDEKHYDSSVIRDYYNNEPTRFRTEIFDILFDAENNHINDEICEISNSHAQSVVSYSDMSLFEGMSFIRDAQNEFGDKEDVNFLLHYGIEMEITALFNEIKDEFVKRGNELIETVNDDEHFWFSKGDLEDLTEVLEEIERQNQ